jgi:hypothetical protein
MEHARRTLRMTRHLSKIFIMLVNFSVACEVPQGAGKPVAQDRHRGIVDRPGRRIMTPGRHAIRCQSSRYLLRTAFL